MDDRLKETLSAMMDDEADELSVRRLLSHAEQDQVRSQWQRWQQVRVISPRIVRGRNDPDEPLPHAAAGLYEMHAWP